VDDADALVHVVGLHDQLLEVERELETTGRGPMLQLSK
jgi:hypothetical protein